MNNKCKILYTYFLGKDGRINKIPRKKDKHKEKLLAEIRKVFPTFMHPYAFGMMSDDEANTSKAIIDIFKNNKVSWFKRLMGRVAQW